MASNSVSTPTAQSTATGIVGRRLFASSSGDSSSPQPEFFNSSATLRNISSVEQSVSGFKPILPAPIESLPGALCLPVPPLVFSKARNPPPPPFLKTVSFMREKLYEMAGIRRSDETEPPSDQRIISQWKNEIRRQPWYTSDSKMKHYFKATQVSNRCFGMMQQIGFAMTSRAIGIVNSNRECTQATFTDLLYGFEEEEMYRKLCDMKEGKIKPKEIRENKKKDASSTQTELAKERDDLKKRNIALQVHLKDAQKEREILKEKSCTLERQQEYNNETIDGMKKQIQTLLRERDFWHKMYTEAVIMSQAKSLQTTTKEPRNKKKRTSSPMDMIEERLSEDKGDLDTLLSGDEKEKDEQETETPTPANISIAENDFDETPGDDPPQWSAMDGFGEELEQQPVRLNLALDDLRKRWESKRITEQESATNLLEQNQTNDGIQKDDSGADKNEGMAEWVAMSYDGMMYFGYATAEDTETVTVRFLENRGNGLFKFRSANPAKEPKSLVFLRNVDIVPAEKTRNSYRVINMDHVRKEHGKFHKEFRERQKVEQYWDLTLHPNLDEIICSTASGVQVTVADLKTLQPSLPGSDEEKLKKHKKVERVDAGWLNDQVINAYLEIQVMKCRKEKKKNIMALSSFFTQKLCSTPAHDVADKIKSWVDKGTFLQQDTILIPINSNKSHWALGVVSLEKKTLSVYDSFTEFAPASRKSFFKLLRTLLDAWNVSLDGWVDCEPTTPQQSDYRSCGVYLLKVAEHIFRGSTAPAFSKEDILGKRYEIAKALIKEGGRKRK